MRLDTRFLTLTFATEVPAVRKFQSRERVGVGEAYVKSRHKKHSDNLRHAG